eukprot:686495-Amorphochlora_amoeboformis.AAC.1
MTYAGGQPGSEKGQPLLNIHPLSRPVNSDFRKYIFSLSLNVGPLFSPEPWVMRPVLRREREGDPAPSAARRTTVA